MTSSVARTAIVAVATILSIVGIAVGAVFNPIWIDFAQERAGVPAITGYTSAEVRAATGAILADLAFESPTFDVTVQGEPVLGPTERSHMVDVRAVVMPFAGLAVAVLAALMVVLARNRRASWAWRGVAWGGTALTVAAVLIGLAIALFFDTAFLVFHLIFFPQGGFMFDPRTQRLVQLFPEPFWIDSATAVVVVGLVVSVVAAIAGRRAASASLKVSGPDVRPKAWTPPIP